MSALSMTENNNHGGALNTNRSKVLEFLLNGVLGCKLHGKLRGHGLMESNAIFKHEEQNRIHGIFDFLCFSPYLVQIISLSWYLSISNINVRVIYTSQFHNFALPSIRRGINSVSWD